MKLVLCSDFQLGSGAVYGTPAQPRLADQAAVLQELAHVVAEQGAELVVFCGDAFQHRRPAVPELLVFRRWLEELPVEYLLVAGNHDVSGPGQPTALEVFGQVGADVYVRPEVVRYGQLVLGILPWAHPGHLRAATGPADMEEHTDALLRTAADLRHQAAEYDADCDMLVTHYALEGVSMPGGLTTAALVGEPVLDVHELALQGWDWVVAGHVHVPDFLAVQGSAFVGDEPTKVVSVGSPYVCDFGEAELAHGCWVVDTERAEALHVPLTDRPFVTLDLGEYREGLWPPLLPTTVDGAVVRVRARVGPELLAQADVPALRRQLVELGAHKVHSVELELEREARARAEGLAEDTEPLEALDAWLEAQGPNVEEEQGQRLRLLTAGYLEGADG